MGSIPAINMRARVRSGSPPQASHSLLSAWLIKVHCTRVCSRVRGVSTCRSMLAGTDQGHYARRRARRLGQRSLGGTQLCVHQAPPAVCASSTTYLRALPSSVTLQLRHSRRPLALGYFCDTQHVLCAATLHSVKLQADARASQRRTAACTPVGKASLQEAVVVGMLLNHDASSKGR